MERTISATEARIHFGELLRRVVEDDETVIVERSGEPQVVVISVDAYKRLGQTDDDPDWRKRLRRAHELIRRDLDGRELPPVEEIIRQMREERDEQILAAVRGR